MSPLTNKLIGNIQKTSSDFEPESFIDTDNVVVIDTQHNRIGINTKDPSCAIHILKNVNNDDESGKIICDTISCNNISFDSISGSTISCNTISCDNISFDSISGSTISCNTIKINNITYATVKNKESTSVIQSISYNDVDVSYINITLESTHVNNIIIETSYISISNSDINNNIYEINSNVTLKYTPETSNNYIEYDFIIYNISGANIQEINSNNNIVSTTNSINFHLEDQDYYSASHLNYIGTISYDNIFFIITISNNNLNNINNLNIDNLNTSIRLLN